VVDSSEPDSVSIALQIPMYILITAGEIMFSITGLEFAYSQVSLTNHISAMKLQAVNELFKLSYIFMTSLTQTDVPEGRQSCLNITKKFYDIFFFL